MTITICISHKEDVDGLSSAILINSAFKEKVSIVLVDYANLIYKLERLLKNLLPVTKGYNRIFICDLGLNKKNQHKFISILGQMVGLGYKVTYIDHHDLEEVTLSGVRYQVEDVGVHHRLAARQLQAEGAELFQLVDASNQLLLRYWRRGLVELVAVAAGQVAAANHHELGQERRILQTLGQEHR